MKSYILLFILISISNLSIAQKESINYINYYKRINQAEELIFLKNDSINGLLMMDSLFRNYDFVFVDDCIEAFQLALVYKRDDLAMNFIKKAMDNGFRIKNLSILNCACLHNYYADKEKKVTVFDSFIRKNKASLEKYEKESFACYLKKIDKALLQEILNRHIKEQIFKNYIPAMGIDKKEYEEKYKEVSNNNLDYIISKFKKGEYIGEKNIGLMDTKMLKDLGITYLNANKRLDTIILKNYNLPPDTYVPVCGSDDTNYFEASPLYIILYHNDKSYSSLEAYKDEAIQKGYLHPREYASLKLSGGNMRDNRINNVKMKLDRYYYEIKNTEEINKMRDEYLLPKYEVDFKKHEFAHKYGLKLFFGFFNGTR